jgi:hypothetical protein
MDLPKDAREEMNKIEKEFSVAQQAKPLSVSQQVAKLEDDYRRLLEENFRLRTERSRILEILLPLKIRGEK